MWVVPTGLIVMTNAVAVVCWSRAQRGYANVEWRFSMWVFAFMLPIRGPVDPAHRSLFLSSTNYR